LAIEALDKKAESTQSLQQSLKAKSYLDLFSYTPEQILDDWFPPEPKP
jgi:hypothetical protein